MQQRDDTLGIYNVTHWTNIRFISRLDGVCLLPYFPVRGPIETRSSWGNTDCRARLRAPQSPRENGSLQRHRWHQSAHGRLLSDHINLRHIEDNARLNAEENLFKMHDKDFFL